MFITVVRIKFSSKFTAYSSTLRNEIYFNGATRDFEHTNFTE